MKFLFVSDFPPDASAGAAGSLVAIGEALTRLGHEVGYEWHLDRPYRLPHPALQRAFELPRRQLRQVERRLAREAFDVVIASQPYAYLVYERLAPRFPETLFLNRTHGWEERVYETQRRHRWHRTDAAGRVASAASEVLVRHACRRTARAAHGILAACSRCADYVRARHRLDETRVTWIPYGLDETFRQLPDPASERSGQRLLYVGNYLPRKGSQILEAVLPAISSEYSDARLSFVVDEPAHPRVEDAYRRSWGERLTIQGWMDRATLAPWYAAHNILLHPSLFEGFGKAWMEGMAAGVLVVGFAEGGLPDLAEHSREALFCEPGDVEAYLGLLRVALEDPAESAAMGARAQRMIRSRTWDDTARATVEYCERLRALQTETE